MPNGTGGLSGLRAVNQARGNSLSMRGCDDVRIRCDDLCVVMTPRGSMAAKKR